MLVRWERKGVNNTVKKRGHVADERENIKGAGIRGLYINRLKACSCLLVDCLVARDCDPKLVGMVD